MTKMTWESPPPKKRGAPRVKWQREADALRKNPGKWAKLVVDTNQGGAHSMGHQIRSGVYAAFRPGGSFEIAVREINAKKFAIYVRYVGDPEAEIDEDTASPFDATGTLYRGESR